MPLHDEQIKMLQAAVKEYNFPAAHYDFKQNRPILNLSIRDLEDRIHKQLLSQEINDIKDGLSNILYWGYSQMGGLAPVRVNRFRKKVSPLQLEKASRVFSGTPQPTVLSIAELKLPEFSQLSFVSKVRMFLDPVGSAALDQQIMKMTVHSDCPVLSSIKKYPTSIPVTQHNALAYENWCNHLAAIIYTYQLKVRVADLERGFFHLIQNGRTDKAAFLLANAI